MRRAFFSLLPHDTRTERTRSLGADSDYFIYPAQCRGYIPLNSIQYGPYNQPRLEQVPPTHPRLLQFRVFEPAAIARAFSLPPSFLPVLAALIGNDIANYSESLHTPRHPSSVPFRGFVDPRELQRIASLLSTCAHMPVETLPQLQDVVFAVLPLLLAGRRAPPDPLIVANLALSALSYALRPLEAPSPSFPLHPREGEDTPAQARAREAYHAAYKRSRLSSFVPHVLKHGVVLCQGSVERPEVQSPMVRLARPLRRWVYAIVQDAVGLAGGCVTEYVRRGDDLHAAVVPVLPLPALLSTHGIDPTPFVVAHSPLALAPLATRRLLLLTILDHPSPAQWPPRGTPQAQLLPLVLALRHLVPLLPAAQAWSPHDVRCALLVGALLRLAPEAVPSLHRTRAAAAAGGADLPSKPLMQHSVELVQTLVALHLVAQSLLLDHPPDADHPAGDGLAQPHGVFDGRAAHALWGMGEREVRSVVAGCPAEVREAVEDAERLVWWGLVAGDADEDDE